MSIRIPIRCRWCGEKGHNKAGCKKLKQYAADNPNSWEAYRLEKRKNAAKHKKCSYCDQEGHNKKTCSVLLEDMVKLSKINTSLRKCFINNVLKAGIAPGAMLGLKNTSGYRNGEYQYAIKDALCYVISVDKEHVVTPLPSNFRPILKVQLTNVYQYDGITPNIISLDIPLRTIFGKTYSDPYGYESPSFVLLSRGHYVFNEKEEEWVNDKSFLRDICESFEKHHKLQYALDAHERFYLE
jgi:hypothetical protein